MPIDPSAKILIVDDAGHMLLALRRTLMKLGFTNILESSDGKEALTVLEQNNDTALVISDWNMEPMDGLALLGALRADKRFHKLPFIMITADPAANPRERAMAAGASAMLGKPFTTDALQQVILSVS